MAFALQFRCDTNNLALVNNNKKDQKYCNIFHAFIFVKQLLKMTDLL